MPTFTPNYNLAKPLVNNAVDQDLWGNELNVDLDIIDAVMFTAENWVTRVVTTTDAPTQADSKKLLLCNATGGAFSVMLPSVADGFTIAIKKTDASANAVTLVGTIDGAANSILNLQNESAILVSNGTDWFIIGSVSAAEAIGTSYDPAGTWLTATNVQDALDDIVSGSIIQQVRAVSNTQTSTTANFPNNAAPQQVQGAPFLQATITPKSAASWLQVEVNIPVIGMNTNQDWIGALFRDAVSPAVTSGAVTPVNATYQYQFMLSYSVLAGSTAATTFRFRYGALGGTAYINRGSSATFGGAVQASITVTEIAA